MGRAEPFYKYDSFDRDISLSFTVAAQSREELIPQYRKLNYLVSNLAPTYSPAGYMGGTLIRLTMGSWLVDQPGFITSLTLGIPKESPWEIGIDDKGENKFNEDFPSLQLPHIVEVKGFNFTPIHTFRPELQQNDYDELSGFVTKYDKQRYISLGKPDPYVNGYSIIENGTTKDTIDKPNFNLKA